jgi:trimethylguanosine synthase
VRAARLADARRRRETTPGFERAGCRADEEGRISLTPETLAVTIAARVAGLRVLDAGCGVGGNAIAFARAGCPVLAVERDATRLALARRNAAIYEVDHVIEWRHGDAEPALAAADVDVLFVDPPWGAAYSRERATLEDYPLLVAARAAALERGLRLVAKVPPSFDPASIPGAVPTALFGAAVGDRHRVKLVLLDLQP